MRKIKSAELLIARDCSEKKCKQTLSASQKMELNSFIVAIQTANNAFCQTAKFGARTQLCFFPIAVVAAAAAAALFLSFALAFGVALSSKRVSRHSTSTVVTRWDPIELEYTEKKTDRTMWKMLFAFECRTPHNSIKVVNTRAFVLRTQTHTQSRNCLRYVRIQCGTTFFFFFSRSVHPLLFASTTKQQKKVSRWKLWHNSSGIVLKVVWKETKTES